MKVLVLGGAGCVWDDEKRARALGNFDTVIAINSAIWSYPGRIDHAVTFHPELLPTWIKRRWGAGHSEIDSFWSIEGHPEPEGIALQYVPSIGGSSGMIAAQVALAIGGQQIVLCGVPLDPGAEHFDRPGAWADAMVYRATWSAYQELLSPRVRSMSGWTRSLLGAPTARWLNDGISNLHRANQRLGA